MTEEQRSEIERVLATGASTADAARTLNVPRRVVAAVKAHVTMRASTTSGRKSAQPANLDRLPLSRKTGQERFHRGGRALQARLADFWRWSDSDLVSNAVRGRLAEYLVALDIGAADGVRSEWVAYDLTTPDGITVEVKSASYIQSWAQRRNSTIAFDVRPTMGWNPDTAAFGGTRRRQADAYVFALLNHQDRATIDPLDVSQWVFHVLATSILDARIGSQQTVGLSRLLSLGPAIVPFGEIDAAVRGALSSSTGRKAPRTGPGAR